MFKTPIRLLVTGVLFIGVPVYTATKFDPSQTLNALALGSAVWVTLNGILYIVDIFKEPLVAGYDEDDLQSYYIDGYIQARNDIGGLAKDRERVIREFYENKLSSIGDEVKTDVTNNITYNDYSTTNNVNPTPLIEGDIIDTKLIKG